MRVYVLSICYFILKLFVNKQILLKHYSLFFCVREEEGIRKFNCQMNLVRKHWQLIEVEQPNHQNNNNKLCFSNRMIRNDEEWFHFHDYPYNELNLRILCILSDIYHQMNNDIYSMFDDLNGMDDNFHLKFIFNRFDLSMLNNNNNLLLSTEHELITNFQ